VKILLGLGGIGVFLVGSVIAAGGEETAGYVTGGVGVLMVVAAALVPGKKE